MSEGPADPRSIFGPAAERYRASSVHGSKAVLDSLVEAVRPNGGTVLDIATGSGHTALAFAKFVDRVIAVDFTRPMLEVCRREAALQGLANVRVCLADAGLLPFRDATFEGVTCRLAPHHFPSVERFVHEVSRVLRPGGWFLLVDTVGPENADAAREIDAIERARDPSHIRNLSLAAWRTVLESVGLGVRLARETSKTLDTADWLDRTAVPKSEQRAILERIDGSQGEVRDYLRPRVVDSRHLFELREGLLLADK